MQCRGLVEERGQVQVCCIFSRSCADSKPWLISPQGFASAHAIIMMILSTSLQNLDSSNMCSFSASLMRTAYALRCIIYSSGPAGSPRTCQVNRSISPLPDHRPLHMHLIDLDPGKRGIEISLTRAHVARDAMAEMQSMIATGEVCWMRVRTRCMASSFKAVVVDDVDLELMPSR